MNAPTDARSSGFSRRTFFVNASALSAASVLGAPGLVAAEPPPEIKKIRLVHSPAICLAPQYLAEELLHLEGFSEVEYVPYGGQPVPETLVSGRADLSMTDAPSLVPVLDTGKSIVVLAGVHAGCYELVATERVPAIRDLKGKTVAIAAFEAGDHILLSSMLAYVGMDPRKDINWVAGKQFGDALNLFIEGKADAFLGFAPEPHEVRRRKIGHVIVNTARDRPWSQYFCCMVPANREFVGKYPVATKRALRAILKGADICAGQPERAAALLVAKGYEPRYEVALEVLKELPYWRWREANPEDTLRFHALRLHEVGMIKTSPQKLVAQGTDWRFLNELKRELKA